MKTLTWADIETAAKLSYGEGRAPNLRDMGAFINANLPGYDAGVTPYSETPYRKIGRLRSNYKTRHGLRLEVFEKREFFPNGTIYPVFKHVTTDPYRRGWEVAQWIVEHKPKKDGKK